MRIVLFLLLWVVIVVIVIILLVLMDLSVEDSIQIVGKVLLALGTTGVRYPVVAQAACLVKGSNQATSSVLLLSSLEGSLLLLSLLVLVGLSTHTREGIGGIGYG